MTTRARARSAAIERKLGFLAFARVHFVSALAGRGVGT